MKNILENIVRQKRIEIDGLYRQYNPDALKNNVEPSEKDFYAELNASVIVNRPFFIAEFKRKSPSQGWIKEHSSVEEQIPAYVKSGARAVSILTDTTFFGGSLSDLAAASVLLRDTDVLLLQKDFILDPIQIYLARQNGANIILLIAAILDPEQMENLRRLAFSLGMGVIVEVHDKNELKTVMHLDFPVLGINNRDLSTFRTALNRTNVLAKKSDKRHVIAESGIIDYRDFQSVRGADGFLIGTGLMQQGNEVTDFARFFKSGEHARFLFKACGIRTERLLREETADFIGINFSPVSKRKIDVAMLNDMPLPPNAVAVFYRNSETEIREILQKYPFQRIQLYAGDVSPDFVRSLRCKIILACAIREYSDLEQLELYAPDVDLFILDGAVPGSGRLAEPVIPADFPYPFLLAGGLHAGNLDAVLAFENCIGVDIASGIELDGAPDEGKISDVRHKIAGMHRNPENAGSPANRFAEIPAYKDNILGSDGWFGSFGGCFVPEILMPGLLEIASAFEAAKDDAGFMAEFRSMLNHFSGRPTAFTPLPRLSEKIGGAQIFLKNEGLNHTGAHKINHCIGQALLAKKLGKHRIIAETGAGQHGYATAAVCARLGLDCTVYMGKKDYERQRPNVYWMELLGARVIAVEDGSQTLNDAVIAAFKDWVAHPDDTYYLLGSAVGPHPFPLMNTFFQKIVGEEIKRQCEAATGRLPDVCIACVGGGSNAMGMFFDFLDHPEVALIGVEAGGRGTAPGEHAAKIIHGEKGLFEGYFSYFLQDGNGNIAATHSVSAGLDYCGISPILAWLSDAGRVQFESVSDYDALEAVRTLAQEEGIIPALESAHAFAYAFRLAGQLTRDKIIVVNASGRGEKDLFITMRHFQQDNLLAYARHLVDSTAPVSELVTP